MPRGRPGIRGVGCLAQLQKWVQFRSFDKHRHVGEPLRGLWTAGGRCPRETGSQLRGRDDFLEEDRARVNREQLLSCADTGSCLQTGHTLGATVGQRDRKMDKAGAGTGSPAVPGGRGAEVRKQTRGIVQHCATHCFTIHALPYVTAATEEGMLCGQWECWCSQI